MTEPEQESRVSFLELPLQRDLLAGRRARIVALAVGCALIVAWQGLSWAQRERLDGRYRMEAATGARDNDRFVPFYYYLGLFPVATDRTAGVHSRADAERLLRWRPEKLLTEVGHTTRYGELGVIWLYLPAAMLRGSADTPTMLHANGGAFVIALVAVFIAFWWAGQPVVGGIVVALVGSSPFQLYEAYGRENVFGWPITTMLLVLALCVPLLGLRRPWRGYPWVAAALAGVLAATTRQIRPDTMALLLGVVACLLAAGWLRWWVRGATVALLAVCFITTSWGWQAYFGHKIRVAEQRVRETGGAPFPGPRDFHHRVWHNTWCGLGDFDTTHGHRWSDTAAYDYARPILKERYGVDVPPWYGRVGARLNEFWDADRRYYRTPQEAPHYYDVLREKVLGDISGDPLWYLGILARRAWRVLHETSPLRLAAGEWWIALPMHGLVAVAVVGVLAWLRAWPWVKLVGVAAPLSLSALLVYSGGGQCLYSCYHLLATAVVLALGLEGALWYARSRGR